MQIPNDRILTPFHQELLRRFAKSSVGPHFFLTGGTALSAFYLFHRLSEDLDLFTEAPATVPLVLPVLQEMSRDLKTPLLISREFPTFVEVFFGPYNGETIKMDFAQDSPFRLKPLDETEIGIHIDNSLDIACNKLSALYGRAEGKDFIDVYFLIQKLYSFDDLLRHAKEKHGGLENYWLALAMQRVERVSLWPTMLVPCDLNEVRAFFLQKARELISQKK
jgi:hypothetical protein